MIIYHGIIEYNDGSRGSFSMSIRGLNKMLREEKFNNVTIIGKGIKKK